MDRFLRMNAAGMGMGQSSAPTDAPVVDTAEQVYISSIGTPEQKDTVSLKMTWKHAQVWYNFVQWNIIRY